MELSSLVSSIRNIGTLDGFLHRMKKRDIGQYELCIDEDGNDMKLILRAWPSEPPEPSPGQWPKASRSLFRPPAYKFTIGRTYDAREWAIRTLGADAEKVCDYLGEKGIHPTFDSNMWQYWDFKLRGKPVPSN